MFNGDNYIKENGFNQSAPFRQQRDNYFHTAIDYNHKLYKKAEIKQNLNGVLYGILKEKFFGNMLIFKHNSKFRGGVDDLFYSAYCHLDRFDESIFKKHGKLVKAGELLGFMGNTGKSLTFDSDLEEWRELTIQEQEDPKESKGVHLHLMYYQFIKKNLKSRLIKEMELKIPLSPNDYFWQWNRMYINPLKIYEYFDYIQGRKR